MDEAGGRQASRLAALQATSPEVEQQEQPGRPAPDTSALLVDTQGRLAAQQRQIDKLLCALWANPDDGHHLEGWRTAEAVC